MYFRLLKNNFTPNSTTLQRRNTNGNKNDAKKKLYQNKQLLMKNKVKFAIVILFPILIMSCGVSNHNNSNFEPEIKEPEPNKSWFFVFNIRKDNTNSTNIVELVSKNEISGKIKTESTNRNPNYLTLYLYSGKQLIDTVAIDHPLYKHYEYIDQNGTFAFKDTIINNADFVLRTQKNISEIILFETLKNHPKKQLTKKIF